MWVDLCYAERGRGDIANDIRCQDKTYSIAKDGVNVIALSDGAGSAKLSHFGAEKVTENIAVYLIDRFEEIYNNSDADAVREEIIIRVNEVVVKTAEELSCENIFLGELNINLYSFLILLLQNILLLIGFISILFFASVLPFEFSETLSLFFLSLLLLFPTPS